MQVSPIVIVLAATAWYGGRIHRPLPRRFCGLRIAKSRNRPAMGYCGTTAIPACRNASPKTFSTGTETVHVVIVFSAIIRQRSLSSFSDERDATLQPHSRFPRCWKRCYLSAFQSTIRRSAPRRRRSPLNPCFSATWKVEMRQRSIRFPPLSARWQTDRPTYSRDTHIGADALADRAPPSVIKKV